MPDGADDGQRSGQMSRSRRALAALTLGALGVVYGDIGTSPLYALRECFSGTHPVPPTEHNVLGVLSLILWSLILIISIKYIAFIMRADNRGEGGILALMALSLQSKVAGPRQRNLLVLVGLFGAALLYGDGVITPAISVLSAVEGLRVPHEETAHAAAKAAGEPMFEPSGVIRRLEIHTPFDDFIVIITLGILLGLFLIQRRGTAKVGSIFGPIMLMWFVGLAGLGIHGIAQYPAVLAALNPWEAWRFFMEVPQKWHAFLVLGAVFLCVTGGEALYADMGHFGRRPIRLAWFGLVLPALMLNYFGQGATVILEPDAAVNPFFRLAPQGLLYPMVGLATLATVIASQALISGAFSLTRQAVQLGFSPRFEIVHTSASEIGQIYMPSVNAALLLGVSALVLGFRSSSALAAAYGVAVTTTMGITTVLAYFVMRDLWKWRPGCALLLCGVFLAAEISFFVANAVKFLDGGWVPLLVGVSVFTLMSTWKKGRAILSERMRNRTFPLGLFLSNLASNPPLRVPGVAVFMTSNPEGTPPALMHNLKHNKVLHQRVVLLTISTAEVPHIREEERVELEALEHGLYRVIARYGFMETPDVPELLALLRKKGLELRMMDTTFFLGRESLIPSKKPGMALWREALFSWMSRNAQPATHYFNLPPNRVVELGAQVEL
ncbi:MAG: potassium transporter Kup [Myxococcaceae bacterium]|nr:potassium transporter Kup [Myxococcaceae bacterium]